MKAQVLHKPVPGSDHPLEYETVEQPSPAHSEVLVRVLTCGVCHTDLHLVEGELPHPALPVIPGHEIIGVVEASGAGANRFEIGARFGIAWLHRSCGKCAYCKMGLENLCENATFTGYTVNGGYAEYV